MAPSSGSRKRSGVASCGALFKTTMTPPNTIQITSLIQIHAGIAVPKPSFARSWVVVGDREKIEAGIRDASFGEILFVDADGQPLPGSSE